MTSTWEAFEHKWSERWRLMSVTGDSPQWERTRIRHALEKQGFAKRDPHSLVLATGGVFDKSVTLHLNGVIDSDLAVDLDWNGFKCLRPNTPSGATQREGRGGRVEETMHFRLGTAVAKNAAAAADMRYAAPPSFPMSRCSCEICSVPYVMTHADALQVTFAAVC